MSFESKKMENIDREKIAIHRDQSKYSKRYYFQIVYDMWNDIDAEKNAQSIKVDKQRSIQKATEHFHASMFCPPILFDVHFNIDCYLVAIKRMSHQRFYHVHFTVHVATAVAVVRMS